MNQADFLQNLAQKLTAVIPDSLKLLKGDLEKNFHAILQSAFGRLDLVTREEFDAQTRVLARCREQLTALEKTIQTLEKDKK
jgi:BMFP domain-containing protein YqiC